MTHQKACKFCGIMVTVESDPDCPLEWAESLLKMLACNRCADFRARMSVLGREVRTASLTFVQMSNDRTIKPEAEAKIRKSLETLTRKVAESACRFYRINLLWDREIVEQIMEHPDKSSAIITTYLRMVSTESRQQHKQPHDNPEAILHGDRPASGHQAQLGLQPDNQGKMAAAKDDTLEPARGAGEDKGGSLLETTVL